MANQDMLAFLGGAGSGLSRARQTDLARAGLSLDKKDLRALDQRRRTSLGSLCRVELGGGALSVIVEAFADSPYLEQDRLAEQLGAIQDAFYELRDQVPVGVADARVAAAQRESVVLTPCPPGPVARNASASHWRASSAELSRAKRA